MPLVPNCWDIEVYVTSLLPTFLSYNKGALLLLYKPVTGKLSTFIIFKNTFLMCGGLKENGPYRLRESSTFRRWGLVGVGCLGEVWHRGRLLGFRCSSQVQCDIPLELSETSPVPCLPVSCNTSLHDNNGLNP